MTRYIDRGAIVAAYVGVGMALVIAVSFLLVIPIEPVYWLMAPLSGLLIGYYADARADRRSGPWRRILGNGLFAGLLTGLSLAILLLGVKALFFVADNGYRDLSAGGPLTCSGGASCVFARYQSQDNAGLARAGITDVSAFTSFYWGQQFQTAGTLIVVTLGGAAGGALAFGLTRMSPRSRTVQRDDREPSDNGGNGIVT
jgi:hypothetical protein